MNEHPLARALHQLAEAGVPGDLDLRAAVRRQLAAGQTLHRKEAFPMKTSFARIAWSRIGTVAALVMLLLIAGLLLTPQGRAWARSALQFFTRSESDTLPVSPTETLAWVNPKDPTGTPAPTMMPMAAFSAECGDFQAPRCSVEQIRVKVDFPVKELGTIPAGMYFTGATGGPAEVYIVYDLPNHNGGMVLVQQPWTGSAGQTAWQVAPAAIVEMVPVGSATAEYVKGSYNYIAGEVEMKWNPDIGQEALRWVDRDVFYTLYHLGVDVAFGKDGLAALAASLTAESVSANLAPMPSTPTPEAPGPSPYYQLTIAKAEELAGFDLREPALLPQVVSFIGAAYQPEYNLVSIFYLYDQSMMPNDNGLEMNQQPASIGMDCALCGFLIGDLAAIQAAYDGKVVGTNAVIETVQIGSVTGQYVQGVWAADEDDTGMRWHGEFEVRRLRWQADGMAFELIFWGSQISKEELVTIAESMR